MNAAVKGWDDDSDDGIPRKAKQLRVCTKQLCRHKAAHEAQKQTRPTPSGGEMVVDKMTKSEKIAYAVGHAIADVAQIVIGIAIAKLLGLI